MFIIIIWFCSKRFKSIQRLSHQSPQYTEAKILSEFINPKPHTNALFLNPKHIILTPRLDGQIPATNSSEMERRKVPERVGFKTKCPP